MLLDKDVHIKSNFIEVVRFIVGPLFGHSVLNSRYNTDAQNICIGPLKYLMKKTSQSSSHDNYYVLIRSLLGLSY